MNHSLPSSLKTHNDENFPVASILIEARFRAPIMAFYQFARAADDIADDAALTSERKLSLLDAMEVTLRGNDTGIAAAVPLRQILQNAPHLEQHPLDLLQAFRRDVEKNRYRDWDELMNYCRYSAAPVGRFVLDVHGQSRSLWPANDALCAALQVINHLQDCGQDYQLLNRVYLLQDLLETQGAQIEDLGKPKSTPQLLKVIFLMAQKTEGLLLESNGFATHIGNFRLAVEVKVIQNLAERLTAILQRADPLSQKVHLSKSSMLWSLVPAFWTVSFRRLLPKEPVA